MKKNLNNELLLINLSGEYQEIIFGFDELVKYLYQHITLNDNFDVDDFKERVLDVYETGEHDIDLGDYFLYVKKASYYSKSQMLKYFEHE